MPSPETLRRMGFEPGRVVETIVASYSASGEPHAAPMGVSLESWEVLTVKPYTETQTYRNLRAKGECTVNLTWSPKLFLACAFKGEPEADFKPEKFFVRALRVEAPRLRQAEGWLEVKLTSLEEDGSRGIFRGKILKVKVSRKTSKAYCRADFAAIESIIHATRLITPLKTEPGVGKKLLSLIASYKSLIGRVAPHSEAWETVERLASILSRKGFNVEACETLF